MLLAKLAASAGKRWFGICKRAGKYLKGSKVLHACLRN